LSLQPISIAIPISEINAVFTHTFDGLLSSWLETPEESVQPRQGKGIVGSDRQADRGLGGLRD
jgi:hypothetical protein